MKRIYYSLSLLGVLLLIQPLSAELRIAVGIPPIEFMVKEIGGDSVEVFAIQSSGDSCEIFEPKPRAIQKLSQSEVYFKIGLGAEHGFLEQTNIRFPRLRVVSLVEAEDGHHCEVCSDGTAHTHSAHAWLIPRLYRKMGEKILAELIRLSPSEENSFRQNAKRFFDKIEYIESQMIEAFLKDKGSFLVLHSAFEEFAAEFGLKQISLSNNSFEFRPREFQAALKEARLAGVKFVLVQPHEPRRQGELLAQSLAVPLIELNTLERDWFSLMNSIAEKFQKAFIANY